MAYHLHLLMTLAVDFTIEKQYPYCFTYMAMKKAQGLKPKSFVAPCAARLKSCPDTKHQGGGARNIRVFPKFGLCTLSQSVETLGARSNERALAVQLTAHSSGGRPRRRGRPGLRHGLPPKIRGCVRWLRHGRDYLRGHARPALR
jgi:hypothetical protein